MILNILLLIIGFVMLVRGADAFVDGAVAIARKFAIPEIPIPSFILTLILSFELFKAFTLEIYQIKAPINVNVTQGGAGVYWICT